MEGNCKRFSCDGSIALCSLVRIGNCTQLLQEPGPESLQAQQQRSYMRW